MEVVAIAPSHTPSLRERKKRRTREEISDVATRLFERHGFEQVTLSQIAAAAEVSVKTIFNHFGSKEDLYFDRAEEFHQGVVATVRDRPPGTTVLQALRGLLTDNLVPFPGTGWTPLEDAGRLERFKSFLDAQDRSPALRARRLTLGEELADLLAGALAEALGRDRDGADIACLAAMLVAVLQVRERTLRAVVRSGLSPERVRAAVLAVVDEAFARLEAAFAGLDRPA
jgi:AcrR family transcriptional regulator